MKKGDRILLYTHKAPKYENSPHSKNPVSRFGFDLGIDKAGMIRYDKPL
jgi:hypothetical protein